MKPRVLTALARATLEEAFGGPRVERPAGEAWLNEPRAVFVTLTKHGELRGCIGQLEARQPLFEAVRSAAMSAAFDDPRFPPLTRDELADLHLEVSVLSPLEPVPVASEAEALAALTPGVHGAVLACGRRRGVFIPEVWKQLPDGRDFLAQLKRKAGLPVDEWLPGTTLSRFTAQRCEEDR